MAKVERQSVAAAPPPKQCKITKYRRVARSTTSTAGPFNALAWVVGLLLFVSRCSGLDEAEVCPLKNSGMNYNVEYETYSASTTLPDLLPGTIISNYGPASMCGFDGTIVVGGPLSLSPEDKWYSYSVMNRQSLTIFLDWLNGERGGVNVGGQRYAMRFVWVDDVSDKAQVAPATAHATRGTVADFAFGGYSSGLTKHAARQSYADGFLMMSGGAASTSVFTQNDLTFGLFPPASTYHDRPLQAIKHAAQLVDDTGRTTNGRTYTAASGLGPCYTGDGGCLASLKIGFVQADATFTRSQCVNGPALARSWKLDLAVHPDDTNNADGGVLAILPKVPTLEQAEAAVILMKEAGVNVVVGCFYSQTSKAFIEAMEKLDWTPLALSISASHTSGWKTDIDLGWWQGEYAIGPTPWTHTTAGKGEVSGMTSSEFFDKYKSRYGDQEVSYHGAAPFAAAISLVKAIENAESLNATLVRDELEKLDVQEFYGRLRFDKNHQYEGGMVVVQYGPGSTVEEVVFPNSSATVNESKLGGYFPWPPWNQRRCVVHGPGTRYDAANVELVREDAECSGNGECDAEGDCVCFEGFVGETCQPPLPKDTFDKQAFILAISLLGGTLGALALAALTAFTTITYRRKRALEAREAATLERQCNDAVAIVQELQSPLVLMSGSDFVASGGLLLHEQARNRNLLIFVDTVEAFNDEFRAKVTIFFSHEWTAFKEPDPDGGQYRVMCSTLHEMAELTGRPLGEIYVWVDLFSMPQACRKAGKLAINALPVLASLCTYFVIVCPPLQHKDVAARRCAKSTYLRRGWCRAEVMSFWSRRGIENMFFAEGEDAGTQLYRLTKESLHDDQAIAVFQGELTCCQLNHWGGTRCCDREELMLPMLGLYAEIYANRRLPAVKPIFEAIEERLVTIYPATFEYTNGDGSKVTKPLFGDLVQVLRNAIDVRDGIQPKAHSFTPAESSQTPSGASARLDRQLARFASSASGRLDLASSQASSPDEEAPARVSSVMSAARLSVRKKTKNTERKLGGKQSTVVQLSASPFSRSTSSDNEGVIGCFTCRQDSTVPQALPPLVLRRESLRDAAAQKWLAKARAARQSNEPQTASQSASGSAPAPQLACAPAGVARENSIVVDVVVDDIVSSEQ